MVSFEYCRGCPLLTGSLIGNGGAMPATAADIDRVYNILSERLECEALSNEERRDIEDAVKELEEVDNG